MVGIDRVVTHGTFELDGGSWEVDNNIWLFGDNSNVVVFDVAHEAGSIVEAVRGRHVVAVVPTSAIRHPISSPHNAFHYSPCRDRWSRAQYRRAERFGTTQQRCRRLRVAVETAIRMRVAR